MNAETLAKLIRSWMDHDCPSYALLDALEEQGIDVGRESEEITLIDWIKWFDLGIKSPVWDRKLCPSLSRILNELEQGEVKR